MRDLIPACAWLCYRLLATVVSAIAAITAIFAVLFLSFCMIADWAAHKAKGGAE